MIYSASPGPISPTWSLQSPPPACTPSPLPPRPRCRWGNRDTEVLSLPKAPPGMESAPSTLPALPLRNLTKGLSHREEAAAAVFTTGWPKLQAWVSVCKWHPAPTARCSLGGLLGRCLQDTICAKRTHYLLTWGSRVPPGLGAARGQQSGGSLTPHPHLASITHSINNQCLFHALLY